MKTQRIVVPALEEILYKDHKVLDHGFIRVIDYMGDDSSVVQAARVSYGKGTKHVNQDAGLINYLMRHSHTTPFEMCEIKFHVKLPIFVARQWIRHRTASVNEYSARYSVLDKEFYIPDHSQISEQSCDNAQGRGEVLPEEFSQEVIDIFQHDAALTYSNYSKFLERGLAREISRINLTLNCYTQWYWKVNLHNLLKFIKLRADKHAQYEIRVYAETMLDIVKLWVPLTYNAFVEYCLEAKALSRNALNVIRKLIDGQEVSRESSGMSKREWNDVMMILEK
ncbi:FAD-dependent thymidylate synthase [Neoehrlichia mikurensis]|uniref:Flavin-dependent thymidylate synthase n=1 Tax=Neoehrlichia mikurensis TaxID=89586 RepID=A0A9Q9BZ23_9RICK|nr:FAD-dependent thymidylate synthase [Neoehrlichia mikurensis]QXK91726.1 FAD-dependent thymidylate synthase [Neoehrlichia mikurensis]QXK92938.1 FAD-dependent thymidylate synthase [Neoehrlichia mikurensis]QXK93416.1 FAD-dependent thymidylate synthase [Neoehrlichia mikurensis]UTO55633.1 FAD-dependent thymidylate synthase [Neoehrlichia mikurensis]UTO56554.1 FAD-dependent thymidylate synthase [Neoehrlichia mikurensis]